MATNPRKDPTKVADGTIVLVSKYRRAPDKEYSEEDRAGPIHSAQTQISLQHGVHLDRGGEAFTDFDTQAAALAAPRPQRAGRVSRARSLARIRPSLPAGWHFCTVEPTSGRTAA